MTRTFFCMLLLLALVAAVVAQQPAQTPAWDVTLKTNTVADSTLTVVNRCSKNHQFQVQLQNLPFLQFASTQVNVKGGATQLVPVKFDTRNLAPRVYQGTVLVICRSCKGEATCTQDREVLQVVLRVTSDSPVSGPPGAATVNPPTGTPGTGGAAAQPPLVLAPVNFANENPGAALENECEELRRMAWEQEAAAAAAQNVADQAQQRAEAARKVAQEADEAAKKAADAAKDPSSTGEITDGGRGRVYSSEDLEVQRRAQQKLFEDYRAGLISEEEFKRRRDELSGLDALDRLLDQEDRNLAKKKFEAEEAALRAETARAAAEAAEAVANEAQKAADEARKEAEAARNAFDEAARKLEEEKRKQREAAALAEKKRRDLEEAARQSAAAAEKLKQEEIDLRAAAEKAAAKTRADNKYLLENIKALTLISNSGFKDTPGLWEWLPWFLEVPIGNLVEEIGRVQMPLDVLKALGGLYQVAARLLDPCYGAAQVRLIEKLRGMINLKTGRLYTESEAHTKVEGMCSLLRELKKRLEVIK